MAVTLSVIVGGVETPLSSLGALVSHTGWGMPQIDTYSLRAPGQHGDSWGGFALNPRIAALIFKSKTGDADLEPLYSLRARLLTLFSPLGSQIVKFVTAEGTRQFDCHYYDGLGLDWAVGDWGAQGFAVTLKCSDSTCYDPAGYAWTFALGGGSNGAIPSAIPSVIGSSTINQSQSITYPGNWGSYPLIRVTGPITDCVIANGGTNEVLDFTGTTIAAGDYYDIDTRYGLKTIVDAAGANKISKLNPSSPSQLNTFHIGAAPEVAGGINSINVRGGAITAATKIEISGLINYLGV